VKTKSQSKQHPGAVECPGATETKLGFRREALFGEEMDLLIEFSSPAKNK
jgi:hypothetical protein